MCRHKNSIPTDLVRSANTGNNSAVGSVTLNIRVSSADTAGAFTLIEVTMPPYWDGCAPHWHPHTTETICVLNGLLVYTLDDITTTASHGTSILIPPGIVHTIWNPTAMPTTYLVWFSPGGCERVQCEKGIPGIPELCCAAVIVTQHAT